MKFHTGHKLLLLSHSRKHYTEMGRLVAAGKSLTPAKLYETYGQLLVQALKVKATRKKNADVLMHAMGYFKRELTHEEKAELLEHLDMYKDGQLPLVVPLTLIGHYIMKYDNPKSRISGRACQLTKPPSSGIYLY